MKIILVAAARPNFMKIAPLIRAIQRRNDAFPANLIESLLVHTGQHYDYEMSEVFFEDLDLPKPDIHLGVGSGSHAEQTGKVMIEFESVLLKEKPDLVIVVGDVNSTLAAALAAVKLHIPIGHVESGVRTGDLGMPEEVNRLLTDHVSEYLFTTSKYDDKNLIKEGIHESRIHRVGNIMADCLMMCKAGAEKSDILRKLGLQRNQYALFTLHRPANVDDKQKLELIISRVEKVAQKIPVVFPAHPRTRKNLNALGLDLSNHVIAGSADVGAYLQARPQAQQSLSNLLIIPPLGYRDMLNLEMNARFVITDSGGIQVETTVLGIPCLTVMDYPVWLITHKEGTNVLVGSDCAGLECEVGKLKTKQKNKRPVMWDGQTAERIIEFINA